MLQLKCQNVTLHVSANEFIMGWNEPLRCDVMLDEVNKLLEALDILLSILGMKQLKSREHLSNILILMEHTIYI